MQLNSYTRPTANPGNVMQQCRFVTTIFDAMKKWTYIILVSALFGISSCKKDNTSQSPLPPCQTLNFGVLEVHYSNQTNGHHIAVASGGQIREKISGVGVAIDTMQLTPGLYYVLVNPIPMQQGIIEFIEDTVVITQCADSVIYAPF